MNRLIYLLAFVLVTGCSSIEVERDYFETTEVIEKAMPALAYEVLQSQVRYTETRLGVRSLVFARILVSETSLR